MGDDFIVTVKLKKNPEHDPKNKVEGHCPMGDGHCTDVTGEHHSFLVTGTTVGDIRARWSDYHITRIEQV